jgi:hypothetical protein
MKTEAQLRRAHEMVTHHLDVMALMDLDDPHLALKATRLAICWALEDEHYQPGKGLDALIESMEQAIAERDRRQ